MLLRVLGCSGAIAAGSRTTAFLLDDDILIDAGTGVGDLSLEELVRIDHIFISHSHLDHVLSIGLMADTVMRLRRRERRPPIQVHALAATIAALRAHIFNGIIWPDFSALPDPTEPVLEFVALRLGERISLGDRCIEALPAEHTVPTVGYAAWAHPSGTGPAWVFTGDTGPNPALWERLKTVNVAALVIETAFCDNEFSVARDSAHLHPALLRRELAQLKGSANVFITHIKPGEVDAVMSEIQSHDSPHHISALVAGQRIVVEAAPVTQMVSPELTEIVIG